MSNDLTLEQRLELVRAKGFSVPESTTASASDVAQNLQEARLYYARSLTRDGRKLSIVGMHRTVLSYVESNDPHLTWTIQTVLQFSASGAALLFPQGSPTVEAVLGNPIALLRAGEVALRVLPDGTRRNYAQTLKYEFGVSGIQSVAMGDSQRQRLNVNGALQLHAELAQSTLPMGLYEWGTSAGEVYLLDYKGLDSNAMDRLAHIASARATSGAHDVRYEKPDMDECPEPLLSGRVAFQRGARLSHVITRSNDQTQISFES